MASNPGNERIMWAAAGFSAAVVGSYLYKSLFAKGTPSSPPAEVPSKIVNTGLKEYSVIYTDRAINLLSAPFKKIMRDISASMKEVYNAHSVALIPGSGSYGMEAVARQYGTGKSVLIIRNG